MSTLPERLRELEASERIEYVADGTLLQEAAAEIERLQAAQYAHEASAAQLAFIKEMADEAAADGEEWGRRIANLFGAKA